MIFMLILVFRLQCSARTEELCNGSYMTDRTELLCDVSFYFLLVSQTITLGLKIKSLDTKPISDYRD